MSKLLFWIVVILVGLLAMRLAARHAAKKSARTARPQRSRTKGPKPVETMVQCAHCGVHLPAKEAVHTLGHYWCSTDHARLGPR